MMQWTKAHWPEIAGGATGAIAGSIFGLSVPGAIIGQAVGYELTHGNNWGDVKDTALVAGAILIVIVAVNMVRARV
jgi:hypothetical protein